MSTVQLTKKNYNGIDLSKFICSILVITIHVSPFGNTEGILKYLNFGISQYIARIAVPFFFVAAGYFLFKKTSPSAFNTTPIKNYLIRIFRFYLIWSIIYLPIIIYTNIKRYSGFLHFVSSYVRNFIFVGSYTHLWYLNALIVAVIIISFLLYKKVKPYHIVLLAFLLYFIGLFGNSWFGLIKPLKTASPPVWNVLHLSKSLLSTTRNGLFDGFLYVSIGMLFAFYGNNVKRHHAVIGFLTSMILLGIEIFLLRYFKIEVRGNDLFLFLVPAAYFFFAYVEQVELKDSNMYKTLRVISSLVFFIHLWIDYVISKLISMIDSDLNKTCFRFLCVSILSIIISCFIYKLSNKDKFRFLQKLYT